MESKEGYSSKIPYSERWISGVLELKAYMGTTKADPGNIVETVRSYLGEKLENMIQRVIILPLPPDFDFSRTNSNPDNPPNCILVVEDGIVVKQVKKRWRPERIFGRKPGYTRIKLAKVYGGFGPKSEVWLSKEKLMKFTKRSLYVDRFYIDRIFSRGKDNSSL